jgi:hypothetical protein
MSQDDFYFRVLLAFVKRFACHKDAAQELSIHKSALSRMLSGKRAVSKGVARRLGYKRVRRDGNVMFMRGYAAESE